MPVQKVSFSKWVAVAVAAAHLGAASWHWRERSRATAKLRILIPRTITENTLRRGFAPSATDQASDLPAGE